MKIRALALIGVLLVGAQLGRAEAAANADTPPPHAPVVASVR